MSQEHDGRALTGFAHEYKRHGTTTLFAALEVASGLIQTGHHARRRRRSAGRPPVGRREHRERFWERIARGQSSEDAGVAAGVSAAVGTRWFRESGGLSLVISPLSARYLSFVEREEIALCVARGLGVREIATARSVAVDDLARAAPQRVAATPSTGPRPPSGTLIGEPNDRRSRNSLPMNALRTYVQDRLAGRISASDGTVMPGPEVRWIGRRHGRRQDRRWATSWSPEQIANRLRVDYPDDASMRISHEAIYQALYVQGRGALRRELPLGQLNSEAYALIAGWPPRWA